MYIHYKILVENLVQKKKIVLKNIFFILNKFNYLKDYVKVATFIDFLPKSISPVLLKFFKIN